MRDATRPAQFCGAMTDDRRAEHLRSWVRLVLTDVHFWVPLVVLVGGLIVLSWIH